MGELVKAGTRAVTVKDLTADRVETFLNRYANGDADKNVEKPAPSTVKSYLQAVKTFFAWAVERRKLLYNPVSALRKRPVKFEGRDLDR